MRKKGSGGIIILTIIIILILVGSGGVYFLFSNKNLLERSNFPEEISGYTLNEFTPGKEICQEYKNIELCRSYVRIEYINKAENKTIHVIPSHISKGRESYEENTKKEREYSNGFYTHSEEWELTWFSDKLVFTTQDYSYSEHRGYPNTADKNNAVVQYFYKKYPPV